MDDVVLDTLGLFTPTIIAVIAVTAVLAIANYLLRRNQPQEVSVSRQMLMLLLTVGGLLTIIFALPISETSRGQLLSLLGIVVTAVVALSSTTFVANIMAGLMLRAVNSFRPGDFVRCGDYFGRVTERGIFHTEIQTEDRDLATLPNLYLVNNPVTVILSSGTIVSANLTLGYDISHVQAEELLKQAAANAGLNDSFVLVGELNDHSVSYRVGGFTDDINRLLTMKSTLRKNILEVMHGRGVEIVSPNFMNQRALDPNEKVIPRPYREKLRPASADESTPEAVIFDKADSAAEKEQLSQEAHALRARLEEVAEERKGADDAATHRLHTEKEDIKHRLSELDDLIKNGDD